MDKPLPTAIESYDDAVRWIYGRINYEQVRPRKSSNHFRLDRVRRLLSLIGSPQQRIPAVHIAGTKGKGSTAAMVDSILRASGIRSGLYTSPHIHRFEERMQVDGEVPSEDDLTALVARLVMRLNAADAGMIGGVVDGVAEGGPTYFEVATLLAWMYFDDRQIEMAVLETGLGGRLDCTNVCSPRVTVITTIGLDHTHILGNTLEEIAAEKAGIIKDGVPVICGVTANGPLSVIEATAKKHHCEFRLLGRDIRTTSSATGPGASVSTDVAGVGWQVTDVTGVGWQVTDVTVPLAGAHQVRNTALAVAAAVQLGRADDRITAETIRSGVAATRWPLRFEVVYLQPKIVLDAAHNPDAIAALVATLNEPPWCSFRRVLIFAASRDKDAAGMLRQVLTLFDDIVLTRFETNPRSTSNDKLRSLAAAAAGDSPRANVYVSANPESALAKARLLAGNDGLVCVAGSIFLAAEVRDLLRRSGDLA